MSIFEERIAKVVADKLNDETVEKMVADAVEKSLKEVLEDQFRWNGAAKKIIEEKVKEAIVPAIELVNLKDCVSKLDVVLTEIVKNTTLNDNKILLENFKELMTEPPAEEIPLEDVFDKYVEYVRKNIDTSELEINYDDSPSYQNVTANVHPVYQNGWDKTEKYCTLVFECVEDDDLTKTIELYKRYDDKYYISDADESIDINSLRWIDDFDIFVATLKRAGCSIIEIEEIEDDDVEVEAEPEASWS